MNSLIINRPHYLVILEGVHFMQVVIKNEEVKTEAVKIRLPFSNLTFCETEELILPFVSVCNHKNLYSVCNFLEE